jgi:excisionase family DNA binding protein
MYAAIRRYRINPECSDEVIRRIAEDFAPLVREVEGLLEYYVLDAGDGVFVTVTVCEDEAGVEESSKRATEWMKQYLATTILSQEDIPNFSIQVKETLQGALYGGASGSVPSQNLPQEVKEVVREEASNSSNTQGLDLLSLMEVCDELKMGKSWVYRRIRSGEIPSVKLGHNLKVKRADLERYLEGQRYR